MFLFLFMLYQNEEFKTVPSYTLLTYYILSTAHFYFCFWCVVRRSVQPQFNNYGKYSALLSLCSAWLSLSLSLSPSLSLSLTLRGAGGSGNLNFFLCLSSSLVYPRLHTENQLCTMPGSALKVCVVGGGWWVVESEFSDRFG